MLHAPHMLYSKLMLLTLATKKLLVMLMWVLLSSMTSKYCHHPKKGQIQIYNFKEEAMQFLVTLFNHIMKKTPINSLFARCLFCLSLNHLADFPKKCEKLFTKILEKLVLYKRMSGKEADTAKQEYSSF